jgi:hypothetical protein
MHAAERRQPERVLTVGTAALWSAVAASTESVAETRELDRSVSLPGRSSHSAPPVRRGASPQTPNDTPPPPCSAALGPRSVSLWA